jgi:protein-S-isoprenylcysteine O-methyltransferase Ste14
LTAGSGLLAAAIASHYRAAPDEVSLSVVPEYLATGGAYAMTRNPMYVGGALMQAGWAILLGSFPVGVTAIAYLIGMDRLGIPFEERLLQRRFGESYDGYKARVPRWL